MKTNTKLIYIILILIILLNSLAPFTKAYSIKIGDYTTLHKEKELPGFVQYKSNGLLKIVMRVYYKDPSTGERLDAFCLEPLKDGVGTGAGDSYVTEISKNIDDMRVWRALYHGYLGVNWQNTSVESDDDWYFVNKLVIHCIKEENSPKSKYMVPTHIANSDLQIGLTLEDIQRRGKKILDEAETLYNYALSSTDQYQTAVINLEKSGNSYISENNLVQNFNLTSNKELKSYDISLENFPEETTYTKSGNTITVKIPTKNITEDINGNIKITNAQVKTCPAFYADALNSDYQDYVVVATPYEVATTSTKCLLKTNNASIEILKQDAQTKKAIPNTTLEISKDGKVVATVKTGSNGKATVQNLYPGTYQVKETIANENYVLSGEIKTVKLEYNKTATITFENTRKTGNLKLIKVDKDNHKIALGNVEFDLYSEEQGKVIGTYCTNADGEILVENLRVGNYSWIEKKTNKWYLLKLDETGVEVKADQTEETLIENELKKGQIKVIKVDLDNNEVKLKDVEFNVLDENGNILETIKTNENGEALTKRYPIRDFEKLTIQETKTLQNYVLNEKPQTVVLKQGEISNITFTNEKKKGKVKVIKVDLDNNEIRLPNVEFNIYDEEGKIVDTLITNENGEAVSKDLPVDETYTIKETKTLQNYVLNEEPQTVVLKQDEITNITFTNEKQKGKVKVIKVDLDNNEIRLPNVEFNIYDEEGKIVDTLITNENGEAVSKDLPVDKTYTIKETKTLQNYVLSEEPQTVVLKQGEITNITFTNEKVKGYIEITKISANDNELTKEQKGTLLSNAVFEIYKENNELVDTVTIGSDGKGKSKLLEYGKYYIKEKESGSDYYLLNPQIYNVEINENLKTVPITIENESVITKLYIEKEGTVKAKPNDEIRYDFTALKNSSNVYLENFTWTDNLPYQYIRITKLYTGTYNEDLNYIVKYKTNKMQDYTEFGTYNTKTNNEIDFAALNLKNNEYITDFKIEFGTVMPGFEAVEKPFIYTNVLSSVKENDKWVNNTKLTGNYKSIELEHKAKWQTTTYIEKKLPRTGF